MEDFLKGVKEVLEEVIEIQEEAKKLYLEVDNYNLVEQDEDYSLGSSIAWLSAIKSLSDDMVEVLKEMLEEPENFTKVNFEKVLQYQEGALDTLRTMFFEANQYIEYNV